MKILKRMLIGLLILAIIAYGAVSYNLAKSIVRPDVMTLEQERNWLAERNLIGDFDNYSKEDYQIKGYNNYTINAQLIKAEDSNSKKYVIITHGFRSNRNGSIKYVDVYRNMGYNVIIYDVRGHGINEKTTVSLGQLESEDLDLIIKDTYSKYGNDIYLGLHGESMGSATSLSVLAKKPNLKFVVADCGFSNLYDLIKGAYQENNLSILIYGVNAVTNLGYGVDMKKTSPIDALNNNEVPILFIHGQNDAFIKPEHSQKMFERNNSKDEIHIVPNAEHAMSRQVLGLEEYSKIVAKFLNDL